MANAYPDPRALGGRDAPAGPSAALTGSATVLVQMIESEIIPRLMLAHRTGAAGASVPGKACAFTPHEIEALCDLALAGDLGSAVSWLLVQVERGAPLGRVYLDLMAPAARRLGEMWRQDLCGFTDVTMALSVLQRCVHELGGRGACLPEPADGPRRILLVPAPGEQHVFGLAVLAEMFRQAGWRTWSEPSITSAKLQALVAREWFDLVGVTVSCEQHLEPLTQLISGVRRLSRNAGLGVLVGGRLLSERPELAAELGADATAPDAERALEVADRLLSPLASRR